MAMLAAYLTSYYQADKRGIHYSIEELSSFFARIGGTGQALQSVSLRALVCSMLDRQI